MRRMVRDAAVAVTLLGTLLVSPPLQAQYTADFQVNFISGTTSNWSGDYIVGSNTVADMLFVQTSGKLANGNGYLGYEASANNNLAAVIGSGSVWSNTGNLYIGNSGADNFLWIADGGAVACYQASYLGYNVSSTNNRVQVTGPGSVWSNSANLYIGFLGAANSLTICEGGQLVNSFCFVGYSNDLNNVLVTGPGSVWSGGNLFIGYYGSDNSMVISNGGQVFCPFSTIGTELGSSNNTVLVTGSGSMWNSSISLFMGYSGYSGVGGYGGNKLVISDGGLVVAGFGSYMSSGSNSVVVSGPGSVWSNSGGIQIGDAKAGAVGNSLVISNGGHVVSASGSVGYTYYENGAFSNSVLVTGPDSVWSNNGNLYLGAGSAVGNSLVISNGGQVIDGAGYISSWNNSVLVTGPESVWTNRDRLAFNSSGVSNTVVINSGGHVFSSGYSTVGGDKDCRLLVTGAGSEWNNNGGLLIGSELRGSNSLVISDGGRVVASSVGISPSIPSSTSSQIKVLGGCLCVTNTAGNGLLEVDFGTLLLSDGVVIADKLQVDYSSSVVGCGTINGDMFVEGGTVLANCGGTLTFTGIVTNNGTMLATDGSALEFYGPVVNNSVIDTMDGTAIFHSTFVNTGTFVDSSYFRVTSIAVQNGDINLTWTSAGGHSNVVQVATGGGGSYSNNFIDLSPVIPIPPGYDGNDNLGTTSYLDVGGATNSPARFYRVRFAR